MPTPRPWYSADASVVTCAFSDASEKTAGSVANGARASVSGAMAMSRRVPARRSTDSGESDACHCPFSMLTGSAPSNPRYEYLP